MVWNPHNLSLDLTLWKAILSCYLCSFKACLFEDAPHDVVRFFTQ